MCWTSRSGLLLIALLCAAAAAAGTIAGRWNSANAHSARRSSRNLIELSETARRVPPVVVVNPHVGEVWESDAAVVRVRLANTTGKPVHLSHIGGNCNCMQVSPEAATIPPRGELEVRLTYDLTDRLPMDFSKLSRTFELALSVEVAGRPLKPFLLSGTCRCHLASSTTVLHFGESNVRGSPPVSRWLDVTTDGETASIRVTASNPAVKVGSPEHQANGWRVWMTCPHFLGQSV